MIELTRENYYSEEADREFMSVSQFKEFLHCEYAAMEQMTGRYKKNATEAMLIGSYVDAKFDGTLDGFKNRHPEIMTQKGELRAAFRTAENVISRCEQDSLFMRYMGGEKQRIMTGEIGGIPWKCRMDSYLPGVAIVDLKVVRTIGDGRFVLDYGYDIQGAVYQEIVRQNTGVKLPFYIAAASKEETPDIEIIEITQNYLDEALAAVMQNLPEIIRVKTGTERPRRCGCCDCCRSSKILSRPVALGSLMAV